MSSNYPDPLPAILPADLNEAELLLFNESLQIIGQPYYTSKLRFRSEYEQNKNRRGVLRSENNKNYSSPTIRIPQAFLDVRQQYYIRVCLVTVENERTKCRYIHPYELEDIDADGHNDQQENAVWYPIQWGDAFEIKSFPNLRIVKKKADDIKLHGDFRVFDSPDSPSVPQLSSVKETIKEFNLHKSQLAFTIGKKIMGNNADTYIAYACTTVFSDELNEIRGKESESESTTERPHRPKDANCRMYKYAPRNGYTEGNDEILIFFTNKLKQKKYGDLKITFEYDPPNYHWSEVVLNLEVKDQMVSFRTPLFPFPIDSCTTVNVVLKQRRRVFEPLTFDYIPKVECPQCQRNAMCNLNLPIQSNPNLSIEIDPDLPMQINPYLSIQMNPNPSIQTNRNKRRRSGSSGDDEVTDHTTIVSEKQESNPELRTPDSALLPSTQGDASQQILDKLADGIASLFSNKDFKPVLRFCRPFIRKRPELLHEAIVNNNSHLIPKFISVAGIEILQKKNQFGETALLHAARLNRVDIVKALLERKNSTELLEDTNAKKQNIFHILALNTDLAFILDLFIDHLLKNSIDISEKFDHIDEDNHTPLQLAIRNNNLSATRHLLKYFDKTVYDTSSDIGDNLIRLAVRYGDLTMLKYLLNERQLIEQRNQSNLVMTSMEVARSMKHDEMVEYFKETFPQPEIDEDENSDND